MESPDLSAVRCFLRGLTAPLQAARLLWRTRGIKRYAVLPLLVNALLFIFLALAAVHWILPAVALEQYAPAWSGAVGVWVLATFKWLIGAVLLFIFFFFGFTAVGMVVASPFNDLLSEKVEVAICGSGREALLGWRSWARATLWSLWDSLLIALGQLGCTLLALPFLLIPVVGVAPLFLINAWFAGLGFMDFPLARHFLRRAHRRAGLGPRRWEIFGLGTGMTLLLAIPGLGLLILPLGVTAATVLYCNIPWEPCLRTAGIAPPDGFEPPVPKGEDR